MHRQSTRTAGPAERAVIDGVLLHPERLAEVAGLVVVDDFTEQFSRRVWRALTEVAGELSSLSYRDAIEVVAVRAADGRPVRAVICDLLFVGLIDGVQVDTSDPVGAAAVVAEAGRRRRVAVRLAEAARAVADHGADPDRVLADLGAIS